MSELKNYVVMRPMEGDRFYAPGEIRVLKPNVAARMVRSGALMEYVSKREPVPLNKALWGSPFDKADEPAPKRRGRPRKNPVAE